MSDPIIDALRELHEYIYCDGPSSDDPLVLIRRIRNAYVSAEDEIHAIRAVYISVENENERLNEEIARLRRG